MLSVFVSKYLISFFNLSSKSPLKRVPANKLPRSSENITAFFRFSGTCLLTILSASPSANAVFPTPGSPTNIGLLLFLLDNT